jgi:hypothetical protein
MFKNVASQPWPIYAYDSTTNEPVTGNAANITANISIHGDPEIVLNDNGANPTELSGGYYFYSLSAAESNGNILTIIPTSSTADVEVVGVPGSLSTVPGNHGGKQIWYVDDAAGSDTNDGHSIDTALLTVGAAVTAAVDGDTIIVLAGSYAETVAVSKSLTLIGTGTDTVITGATSAVTVTADSVELHKLRLVSTGSNPGIDATAEHAFLKVHDVEIQSTADWCIEGSSSNNTSWDIQRCELASSYSGIKFGGGGVAKISDVNFILDGTSASGVNVVGIEVVTVGGIPKGRATITNCLLRLRRVETGAGEGCIGVLCTDTSSFVSVVDSYIQAQLTGAAIGNCFGIRGDTVSVRGCQILTLTGGAGLIYDLSSSDTIVATNTVYDRTKTSGTVLGDYSPTVDLVDTVTYEKCHEILMATLLGVADPASNTVNFKRRDGTTSSIVITYGTTDGERTLSTIS